LDAQISEQKANVNGVGSTQGRFVMTTTTENITDRDIEALRALAEEFARVMMSKNWDKLLSMLTDDIVIMNPDQPIIEGKKDVLAWLETYPNIKSFTNQLIKAEGCGNFAWARGMCDFSVEAMPGQLTPMIGKWTCTYRKQVDGTWLCASDIWNLDK
jgi:ketosteroid isomerase-like protein